VVTVTLRRPFGLEYLALVTRLLQDARRADPTGGLWEAADLQWWWRIDQHADPDEHLFVMDGDAPVAAVVCSRWRDSHGLDLLGASHEHADVLWDFVATHHEDATVTMMLRSDDEANLARAQGAGFTASDWSDATAWLDAADRPPVTAPPDGYELASYGGGPHPMQARNGEHVAERLAECNLYRPDLDLAIRTADSVAGYALFWADPVTGVGLVEPMRVEDEHAGRGLGKALITAGLDRLAASGCTRLKVSYEPGNVAAVRLYLGAGFEPESTARSFTRKPATSP
jgi:ribosomal protein S18 acetylase RimI-like enzyme